MVVLTATLLMGTALGLLERAPRKHFGQMGAVLSGAMDIRLRLGHRGGLFGSLLDELIGELLALQHVFAIRRTEGHRAGAADRYACILDCPFVEAQHGAGLDDGKVTVAPRELVKR